jgi:hypothetical protein
MRTGGGEGGLNAGKFVWIGGYWDTVRFPAPNQQAISVPPKRTHIQTGQKLELDLTPAERKAILDHLTLLPPEYEAMLKKVHPDQPLLLTLDELEDFSGYVAAEANHTNKKKLETVLGAVYEKMADLLDEFTDEEPPKNMPEKKPVTPKQEKRAAQQKARTAENARYIAEMATTVLRAAEKLGVENRRLERYTPNDLDRLVLTSLPSVKNQLKKRIAGEKDEATFTVAEVAGMLLAIAEDMHQAPIQQQPAMVLVAYSLLAAMREWTAEGESKKDTNKKPRAKAGRAKTAKKKHPGRKKQE